jgi:hypothetical protein
MGVREKVKEKNEESVQQQHENIQPGPGFPYGWRGVILDVIERTGLVTRF